MRVRITSLVLISIISGLFSTACTKKRPEINQQGQIKDLLVIKKLDGAEYPLKTFEQIERAENTKAEKLQIDADMDTLNNFGYVRYESSAELLGKDVPFRGRENSDYKVIYSIKPSEKTLVVYKVGAKNQIPHDEHPFAVSGVAKNAEEIAVPLMGYRIYGFYRIEKMRNSDNEETNVNVEIPESDFRKATHMRIDKLDRQAFEPIKATDVYPAKYFEGEWYYAQTIVAATLNDMSNIGYTAGAFDTNMSMATRIQFLPTKSYLLGVNLNIDERLKNDELNYAKVVQIPVEWMDSNVMKHFGTRVLNPTTRSVFWAEASKSLIKIDFENSVATADAFTDQSLFDLKEEKKLVMLQFSKDYFSYTLYDPRLQQRIKHAFQRVGERKYAPKVYAEKDFEKFGFFSGSREQILNHQIHRREDIFKNRFLARFNPENKEIVFHMTTSSPDEEWITEIARQAVQGWDKAFQAAGTGIHIRLDETKRVELGDIRFNTLNFIKAVDSTSLGGLGPMLIDNSTGEVISTTSNIHVTTYLSIMTDSIRDYIRAELGELDDVSTLLNLPQQRSGMSFGGAPIQSNLLVEPIMQWQKNNQLEFLPENLGGVGENWLNSKAGLAAKAKIARLDGKGEIKTAQDFYTRANDITWNPVYDRYNPMREIQDRARVVSVHTSKIKSLCPEVDSLIQSLKANGQKPTTEQENSVTETCAQVLSTAPLVSVVIHEMGHNFGLRHNFSGSVDAENFLTPDSVESIYGISARAEDISRSSSIMDYTPINKHDLLYPGLYDIAAIRYGYADTVETQSGIVKLKNNETLEQVQSRSGPLKSYKFCTDENVSTGIDPMCQRHDYGATPSEIVDNIIADYYDQFALNHYRFDRINGARAEQAAAAIANRTFLPLRRYYDRWRMLLREILPEGKEYLDGYNVDNYKNIISSVETGAVQKAELKEYAKLRTKIFDFLTSVAFTPNRYCLAVNETQNIEFIELEEIRKIFALRGISDSASSCKDSAVVKYFANEKLKLVKEFGHPTEDIRFSLLDKDATGPIDVTGVGIQRVAAMNMLSFRPVTSILSVRKRFYPSVLDEPDFRERLVAIYLSRLFNGADLSFYVKDAIQSEENQQIIANKFTHEKSILAQQFGFIKTGMFIPYKESASYARYQPFQAVVTPYPQNIQGFPITLQTPLGYIGAREEWTASVQMIQKLKEIEELLSPVKVDLKKIDALLELIKPLFTDAADLNILGRVNSKMQDVVIQLQAAQGYSESEVQAVWSVFGLEFELLSKSLNAIDAAIEKAKGSGQPTAELEAKRKELEVFDLTPIYKQAGFEALNVAEVERRYALIKQNIINSQNMSGKEKSEMESQREILLMILQDQP